jgi:DNA-binding response OmpR family regulator
MRPLILCIEDDADIALAVRIILSRSGFDVLTAGDGGEGLRAFHASRPELVLLDIGLPVLDGWEVLSRIRDGSEVPVLLLTARETEIGQERARSAGADGYLIKPFSNADLVAAIHALLRPPRPRELNLNA